MARMVVVAVVVIGSAACATLRREPTFVTPPPGITDPAHDPLIRPFWIAASEALVIEACTGSEDSTPRTRTVELRPGIKVTQNCGLVSNEVYAPEYVARFAHDVCGITDDTLPEACSKRFTDMVAARIAERYRGANWAEIDRTCRAHPLQCQEARGIERLAIASHDADVERWYQRSAAEVSQRRQAAMLYADEQAHLERVREAAERSRIYFTSTPWTPSWTTSYSPSYSSWPVARASPSGYAWPSPASRWQQAWPEPVAAPR